MGRSYDAAYGETSGHIHFSLHPRDPRRARRSESLSGSWTLLLAIAILARSHQLIGQEPQGLNRTLLKSAGDEVVSSRPKVKTGDFVIGPDLQMWQVVGLSIHDNGNASCEVRLAEGAESDRRRTQWMPEPWINLFMDATRIQEDLENLQITDEMDPSRVEEAMRLAVCEVWSALRSGMDAAGR